MSEEQKTISYSIVIPVFNEAPNLVELHQQIRAVMEKIGKDYEIIFVDDGSVDNSLEVMRKLSPLTIISFRRNFGQTAAMDAGFKQARGEIIIPLDADLQNPPSEIPRLLAKMDKTGTDVVSGWRKHRKDSFFKRFTSRGANFLRHFLVNDGIHDSGCTLKAYKRECFEGVDLHGEMHRFIPAILRLRGFSVAEVVVEHRPRTKGVTKYNWKRTVKGFLDMLSIWFWRKYSARPLHLFGTLGLLMILASFVCGACAFYQKIFQGGDLSDTAFTLFSGFFFLFGLQMFVSGLLGDVMIKGHYAATNTTSYVVKELIHSNFPSLVREGEGKTNTPLSDKREGKGE